MTPRQEALDAGRVADPFSAEREAYFIARVFGSWKGFERARPRRLAVRGANGLWSSFDPVIARQIARKKALEEAAKAESEA